MFFSEIVKYGRYYSGSPIYTTDLEISIKSDRFRLECLKNVFFSIRARF